MPFFSTIRMQFPTDYRLFLGMKPNAIFFIKVRSEDSNFICAAAAFKNYFKSPDRFFFEVFPVELPR